MYVRTLLGTLRPIFISSRDPSTSITRTMSCIPKFIPVDGKGSSVQGMSKGCQFRLVSFNILAQELDEYETFYKEEMKKEGYLPVYVQRRGRKRDGCGIFYQNKRAELLFEEPIDYNDLVPHDSQDTNEAKDDESPDYCVRNDENTVAASDSSKGATAEERGDPNDPKVRLKRDCVGLLTAFKLLESSNSVIVIANTHIYWDPEWIDVKLAQVKYLISRLARFVEKVSEELKCSPLVIVAGDFNSTPGDEVYQYLTTNSNETNSLTASDAKPLAFHSLYSFLGGEPAFTNCTPDFTGTLDYILFANPDRIQPITYLQLPSADSSEVHGGLPNANYPSDHLPIGADFEIL